MSIGIPAILALWTMAIGADDGTPWFQVRVVDGETGRGVPMVALRTTNEIVHYTDSHGIAAIHEPGLMGREVFVHVSSHGYRYPEDRFGMRGVALNLEPGGTATIELERENIAERLYRITGQGIYRDSVLTGEPVPLDEPVLNGDVMGQDSVLTTVYQDRVFWIWGDTGRPGYPLGNFQSSGAVSDLPGHGGLDPSEGINLEYFVDDTGFTKPMCPIVDDRALLIWLDALMTVPDADGRKRLVARQTTLKSLGEPVDHGLVVFDDEREEFETLSTFDLDEPWRYPQGHAVPMEDDGVRYYVFPRPFPLVRVTATLDALQNPEGYEAFTCLEPGGRMNGADSPVMRDADGKLVWAWRADTDPVGQDEEQQLVEAGLMDSAERRFHLQDMESDETVQLHRGSLQYNAYLDKWIMIGSEIGGRSFLGEVWFAEAPSPSGPWTRARRIVTHDQYSFYNPAHHAFFNQDGGRLIYFEGTYTTMFSGQEHATPRYDYNQIMYRLDVSDPRLR